MQYSIGITTEQSFRYIFVELTDAKIWISNNASLCWVLANWVTYMISVKRLCTCIHVCIHYICTHNYYYLCTHTHTHTHIHYTCVSILNYYFIYTAITTHYFSTLKVSYMYIHTFILYMYGCNASKLYNVCTYIM